MGERSAVDHQPRYPDPSETRASLKTCPEPEYRSGWCRTSIGYSGPLLEEVGRINGP
jgi:hypothetical protein